MAFLSKKDKNAIYHQNHIFNLEFLIVIKNGLDFGMGKEVRMELELDRRVGWYEMSRENELILHGYAHFLP